MNWSLDCTTLLGHLGGNKSTGFKKTVRQGHITDGTGYYYQRRQHASVNRNWEVVSRTGHDMGNFKWSGRPNSQLEPWSLLFFSFLNDIRREGAF